MTGGHGHDHDAHESSNTGALRASLGLIVAFMIFEVAVAVLAHSLALLADAGHMLTDAAALAAALWAIGLAARPATNTSSFGLKRAEILAAAVNGVTLVAVAGIVTVEAIRRLISPCRLDGTAVLAVALVGVVDNVAATWLLARGDRSSLNVEGAFQHILTDAAPGSSVLRSPPSSSSPPGFNAPTRSPPCLSLR